MLRGENNRLGEGSKHTRNLDLREGRHQEKTGRNLSKKEDRSVSSYLQEARRRHRSFGPPNQEKGDGS